MLFDWVPCMLLSSLTMASFCILVVEVVVLASHILFGESHLTHALQKWNSCLHFLLWFVVDTIISIVLQILKYDSFHLKFPFHPSCNHFTQLFDCGGWWWFMVKTVDVMIWWLPNQETQERIGTMTSKTNFPLH